MEKKIYKLEKRPSKYKVPTAHSSKSLYDLQMYLNKSRVRKGLNARKKLVKKYKRPNGFLPMLKLLAFYYALVGLVILLAKLGI
ncbi:MAG: hypothetical protein M0R48_07345 [Candidatus Omnitrophica bacterium]|jgi:hypothetical protein|nr:hypothetical protein [Candidatus Omnitrophota bacterium]